MLSLFRRKDEKWHEVRWRSGPRRIFMALRFATTEPPGAPEVEKLPPAEGAGETKVDQALIVREVETAVAEYNRMNHCASAWPPSATAPTRPPTTSTTGRPPGNCSTSCRAGPRALTRRGEYG